MIGRSILIALLICALQTQELEATSRWFTAAFNDLKFTLHRFGYCVSDVGPMRDYNLNETEYLLHTIKVFLDEGNYDNEQLANVTQLMDSICRTEVELAYPISVNLNVSMFSNPNPGAKEKRCKAIDESLDSMYWVFKRAALNRSEPLDFSTIQFYPNASQRNVTYNLTDLINTSWIKSETTLENVCRVTDWVRDYVTKHMRNSTAQDRSGGGVSAQTVAAQSGRNDGYIQSLIDFLDRLLDPILGLERRFLWETGNRIEQIQTRLGNGFGVVRGGLSRGYNSTRDRVSNWFRANPMTNSTMVANTSAPFASLNTTAKPLVFVNSTSKPTTTADWRTSGWTNNTSPKPSIV